MTTTVTIQEVRWCAMECQRQQSGELSVSRMVDALVYARDIMRTSQQISIKDVKLLGLMIEPEKNQYGFRTTPVYFRDMTDQAISPQQVEASLRNLIYRGQNLTAIEGYTEFEKIHPFNDGNGRVGAILYNLALGYPDLSKELQTPPDVFGGIHV